MVRAKILALAGATASAQHGRRNAADLPPPCPADDRAAGRGRDRRLVSAWRRRRRHRSLQATSSSPDQPGLRLAGELAHRPEGHQGHRVRRLRYRLPWNNWLRFDVTGEYRIEGRFKVIGSYTEFCPGGRCFDVYDGDHSGSAVPRQRLSRSRHLVVPDAVRRRRRRRRLPQDRGADRRRLHRRRHRRLRLCRRRTTSKWSFAWALHAGLAYNVTNNFKVEFAYRYLNMGASRPRDHRLRVGAGCGRQRPARLLHAHQLRLARLQDRHALDAAAGSWLRSRRR